MFYVSLIVVAANIGLGDPDGIIELERRIALKHAVSFGDL